MTWTTPADLTAQLQRLWEQGVLLRAALGGEAVFPLRLRLKKPGSTDLTGKFDVVRQWIRQLQEGEGDYRLVWKPLNHRQLGRNLLPDEVWVDDLDAALRRLGKRRETQRCRELSETTLAAFPELREWLLRQPLRLLEHADDWAKALTVLRWFRARPESGLYLRQLDIPGVDSKFIEQRRGLLSELLDLVLAEAVNDHEARGARGFNRRYGLRDKPVRARLRLLDPVLRLAGLSDVEAPVGQLAALRLPLRRVFVTENEINFLAFPEQSGSAVLFGQGYALDRLAEISWLHDRSLYYWGDLDTHGFAILDRLRAHLPEARSFLMDRDTLLAHRALWGTEPADKRSLSPLSRLDDAEALLYDDLRHDRVADDVACVRLEQEHVRFSWLEARLADLDR
ncbi:DUF3322 domain-containing protein [Stutzerimonas stutzeri]|uniref:DUF3322 domain-containing protein n=1 Tax=Stutzerimonas stutzeri TaxID=316 RepID=UPI00210A1C78|nr:DUF3322 domain-containing protein [Stutzerimonas stutzeri]MCQ4322161.1 DUF3322 domain-containing protein [Stutzerimonas stutzeri]